MNVVEYFIVPSNYSQLLTKHNLQIHIKGYMIYLLYTKHLKSLNNYLGCLQLASTENKSNWN